MTDLLPLEFIASNNGKETIFFCDHEVRNFCNGSCMLFKWEVKAKINHDKREVWKEVQD